MATENNNVQPAIDAELEWFAEQRKAAGELFDMKSLSLFTENAGKFAQK